MSKRNSIVIPDHWVVKCPDGSGGEQFVGHATGDKFDVALTFAEACGRVVYLSPWRAVVADADTYSAADTIMSVSGMSRDTLISQVRDKDFRAAIGSYHDSIELTAGADSSLEEKIRQRIILERAMEKLTPGEFAALSKYARGEKS